MGGSPSTGESGIGPNDAIIRLTAGANESKLVDDITSVLSKTFPDNPLAIMDDQNTGEVVMSTSAQSSKAGLPVGARARVDTPVKRIELNMVYDNQLKEIEEHNLATRVAMNVMPEFQKMAEWRRGLTTSNIFMYRR